MMGRGGRQTADLPRLPEILAAVTPKVRAGQLPAYVRGSKRRRGRGGGGGLIP